MKPLRSNTEKETCSPVSSNCVIWQGPDLCCINLCTGDSISDVTHKLAHELCKIQNELQLSDLDMKCLFNQCLACPEPEKTLGVVLQLLVNKVCELQDLINALSGGPTTDELTVRIAYCFISDFTDANGDVTRDVKISVYIQKIAQKVCSILTRLTDIENQVTTVVNTVDDLDGRVADLESKGKLTVTPTCTYQTSVPKEIDDAWEVLEQAFCDIRSATGLGSEILTSIGDGEELCAPVAGQAPMMLTNPNMPLWVNSSATLADTLLHLWKAVCDLRGAVKLIQDNCCKITCDDIKIDFYAILNPEDTTEILLFFASKSFLPTGFYDCNTANGTTFKVVDGQGYETTVRIKLREDVFDDNNVLQHGYAISLTDLLPVQPKYGMTFTSDVCLTDGTSTCVKCVSVVVPPLEDSCCLITNTGSSENIITYKICTAPTTTTTTKAP